MRTFAKIILGAAMAAISSVAAHAQYYQLINQATDMLQTALMGGQNYRGFVEASYLKGIGNKQADFLELSTTQGFKYKDWFFMGVGAGIDLINTQANDNGYRPGTAGKDFTTSAAMVPLYTDFRFNIGQPKSTSFFIDLRLGAAFYISGKYISVGDGYINSSESFYLRPSVGLRVPISSSNPKLAMNIGAGYQLLTNSYWYAPGYNNSVTLNSIGASVSFEW